MGKEEKGEAGGEEGLDKILESYPKIEGRYEKSIASVLATASIAKGKIAKIELIYKGEVIEKETRTSNLEKEQRFEIKEYGTGWYKVRATADNRKNKNSMDKSDKRNRCINNTSSNI